MTRPAASTSTPFLDRLALAGTAALSVAFFGVAAAIAARAPLWMDEVLAVWTARRPDAVAIWDAVRQGSEFSPPLYHLLLHAIIEAGGDSPVILRLPSIVAVYLVGVCAFVLVRRRAATPLACLALAACLTGILFDYAVQARQYALVAACFSLVLVLRDVPPSARPSWPRAGLVALLLAIAVALHFYAVLLVAAVGLMEVLWSLRHRRLRLPFLIAIALAGLSILLWLPIMWAAGAYSQADAAAPFFYARPTLARLGLAYALVASGEPPIRSTSWLLLAALAARVAARRTDDRPAPRVSAAEMVTCAIPLIVFAFALVVTRTFNDRYVVAASIGFAIVIGRSLALHRHGAAVACGLLILPAATIASRGVESLIEREPSSTMTQAGGALSLNRAALVMVRSAPGDLPIVTGAGLRFFELREGDATIARRLVFLMPADLSKSPDPTNDHQVERWARIAPDLPIRDIAGFAAANRDFLLFTDATTVDLLPHALAERGFEASVLTETPYLQLSRMRCPVDRSC